MQLNKIIDEKVRRLLNYNKSTNISAQDLKRVDVLSLANEPIKNLGDISNMSNLKKLDISGTKINDISCLEYTSKLEVFAAYEHEINDFSILAKMPKLKELYLNRDISDKNKMIIGQINSLEILSIGIKNDNLLLLKNLYNIKKLQIVGNSIDLTGIEYLSNLETLVIDSNNIENLELLKKLPNLKEFGILDKNHKQQDQVNSLSLQVKQIEEDIYPAFVSKIGNFKLSSGLKSDAKDTMIAFNIIWAVIIVVLMIVYIFNPDALKPIWQTIAIIIGSYFFFPGLLSLWLYLMDFELEMTDEEIIIQRVWGYKRIKIEDILHTTFKEPNMKQTIIKIRTYKAKYRLACSVFASYKHIGVFKQNLKDKGIKIINKL
jgi:hypothetical protein